MKIDFGAVPRFLRGIPLGSVLHFLRGIPTGIVFTALLFIIVYAITRSLTDWLYFSVPISLLVASITLIFPGYSGFKTIQIVHKGIPLFIGRRLRTPKGGLDEGLQWILPPPIGGFVDISVKEVTQDVPMHKVLTEDRIPLEGDLSIQWKVKNPFLYSNVDNPIGSIKQNLDRLVRELVREHPALEIDTSPDNLRDELLGKSDEGKHGLQYYTDAWGIDVKQLNITSLRLPKNLEEALENVRVEEQQTEAERIEMENVVSLMKKMREKFPNLSDQEILTAVQAERGKRTAITVDGTAPVIVSTNPAGGVT